LIVAMLAVPAAAAMASTGGTDRPGQGQFVCPPPYLLHHRPHFRHLNRYRHRHHKPRRNLVCSVSLPFQQPPSQNCPSGYAYGQPPSFTFDVAPGSSTVYEVSGPTLAPAEEFTYDGNTYTIWTVNPGDDSFTMSVSGSLYVNGGPDITDATGHLLCSG
jgi:hypothetical protein